MNPSSLSACLIGLLLNVLLCYFISKYFAKTVRMPFDWIFFFLFCGGYILGLLIILLSGKKDKPKRLVLNEKKTISVTIVFLIASIIPLIWALFIKNVTLPFMILLGITPFLFGCSIFWENKLRESRNKATYSVAIAAGFFIIIAFTSIAIYGWKDILMRG